MTTKNTISVVYLLLCLFITSVSAQSVIRQFTDGSNTKLQQESEAGPVPTLEKADYSQKHQEISSRNYEPSASNANRNPVTGLRDRRPTSYAIKMESFNTLLNSKNADRYDSSPFTVGGYNWTLVVYPNGNTKDSGSGFLSLYVAIDNSSLVDAHEEVYADLRFYIYNKKERKYFTIQDTDVWRFTIFKPMWGFPQALSVNTFKNSFNGYLYDGDHCEFGVDVTIPTRFKRSELFTVAERIANPIYTWSLRNFSTLLNTSYKSDVYRVGGKNWNIEVFPNGIRRVQGNFMSMFLIIDANEKLKPNEKIYCRGKLRLINQRPRNNIEMPIDYWFDRPDGGYGGQQVIPLSDLKDPSKGFLVNDVLTTQIEFEAVSSTTYFPR